MSAFMVRLLMADDPVAALFTDLKGNPDENAATIWSRLLYLEQNGLCDAFAQAGVLMARPDLPVRTSWWLLILAGDHAVRRGVAA